jgi:large subunit ribosomal protein L13
MAKPGQIERKWLVLDAEGQTLGAVATEAAVLLRGKHKPVFTPHVDAGDFVIVVNAEKVVLTGNKLQQKEYITHSGFPGGLKRTSYAVMLKNKPERVMEKAVRGMLPKTRLGDKLYRKLKVYRGPEHPHQAQKPEVWKIRA